MPVDKQYEETVGYEVSPHPFEMDHKVAKTFQWHIIFTTP